MINLIVTGVCGKMGNTISRLASTQDDLKLVGLIEQKGHSSVGEKLYGITITDAFEDAVCNADMVIDFTTPEATMEHIKFLVAQKDCGAIIGTTGFTKEQFEQIKGYGDVIPILWSSNMSVGMNLLFTMLGKVARALGDGYDVEIIEMHHHHKKDAPSGSAIRLAHAICEGLDRKFDDVVINGRSAGIIGERKSGEIAISAIRAGDILGEHTVLFGGEGERIEITHRVHSRDVFGWGALRAARWLTGKPPGFYDMNNVLGGCKRSGIRRQVSVLDHKSRL